MDAKLWVTAPCDRITIIVTPPRAERKQNSRIAIRADCLVTPPPERRPICRVTPPNCELRGPALFGKAPLYRARNPDLVSSVPLPTAQMYFVPMGTKANVGLFLIYDLVEWRNQT
jgi:hypothetical protein